MTADAREALGPVIADGAGAGGRAAPSRTTGRRRAGDPSPRSAAAPLEEQALNTQAAAWGRTGAIGNPCNDNAVYPAGSRRASPVRAARRAERRTNRCNGDSLRDEGTHVRQEHVRRAGRPRAGRLRRQPSVRRPKKETTMIRLSISIIAAMLAVGARATAPSVDHAERSRSRPTSDSPLCVPRTCAGLGVQCGTSADGCGGLLWHGTCSRSLTCVAGRCVRQSSCTPMTCAQLRAGAARSRMVVAAS